MHAPHPPRLLRLAQIHRRPSGGAGLKERAVAETSERDNDFDLDAWQRLVGVNLEARRDGWTPTLLIAAANLNLHLGHLAVAEDFARRLYYTHPSEGGELLDRIRAAREAPWPKSKKDGAPDA